MAPDESHATRCTPHTMTPHTTSQRNTAHPARPHHITMPHAVAPHSATPHTTTPHHTHHTTHHNTTQRMHHIATTHTPTAHPQHKPLDEHTCGRQAQLVVYTAQRAAMGKHMSDTELDQVQEWKSKGAPPLEIWRRLARARSAARDRGPSLMAVRRALRGSTFKRSKVETRGRKHILSPANLRALESS